VILDGTLATDGASLARVTMSPSGGARSRNVTVPVDGVPPATLFGFTVNDASVGLDGGAFATATSRTNTSRLLVTSSATRLVALE
jgi:hypothetical protein